MREHVSTYDEAVAIHREYPSSPIAEHNRGYYRKLMALGAVGMTVASLALGIFAGYPLLMMLAMLPSTAFVLLLLYIPYHRFKKDIARIEDGSYFEDKDPAEIIEGANRYIDSYNEHVLGERAPGAMPPRR